MSGSHITTLLAFTYGIADCSAKTPGQELREAFAHRPRWSSGAQLFESDPDAFYLASSAMGISPQDLADAVYKIMAPTAKAIESMRHLGIGLENAQQFTANR
jgi:hypothetical protein